MLVTPTCVVYTQFSWHPPVKNALSSVSDTHLHRPYSVQLVTLTCIDCTQFSCLTFTLYVAHSQCRQTGQIFCLTLNLCEFQPWNKHSKVQNASYRDRQLNLGLIQIDSFFQNIVPSQHMFATNDVKSFNECIGLSIFSLLCCLGLIIDVLLIVFTFLFTTEIQWLSIVLVNWILLIHDMFIYILF